MEYLWTPWRMTYISGGAAKPGEDATDRISGESSSIPAAGTEAAPQDEQAGSTGCVFCDALQSPASRDRKNLVLLRGTHNFVILNLYPYNSAHLMVVPNRHTADFPSLDAATLAEMMALIQRMVLAIKAEYNPEGFNMGMNMGRVAGAGVADHVHMHLVPRWAGDTNFMPVVGATKVLPELLETTYDRLKTRLAME